MALLDKLFSCRSRKTMMLEVPVCSVPEHLINDPQDREEDGFLLIGQTSSERTTVTANQQRPHSVEKELPPSYDSQVSILFTIKDDMSSLIWTSKN